VSKKWFITAIVALVGAAVVYALFRFNYGPYGGDYGMYLIVNMIGLLFIPMMTVFLIFRADPASFGFAPSASRKIWVWAGVLFAGLFVLMVFAARGARYQEYYPIFRRFTDLAPVFADYPRANPFAAAPWVMLYAELSYGLYLFCWEFFYRGYLLFGLQKSLGSVAAVLLQAVAFGLMHYGKPEMIPSFGAGIILGILALNAKSFVPGFVLHWAAAIGFDVLVVAARH
jgi:membrane protease YdiL (CAAX protease family)